MDFVLLADGSFTDTLALLKEYGPYYGPLVLAVTFFIWRDWKREDALVKRITGLEEEMRDILLPLVKDCSSVIAKNTTVMERLEKYLND